MSRYIDADALLAELQEEIDFKTSMYTEEQNQYFNAGLKCAYRDVKSQPTADVVEVVRCKDCKYCKKGECLYHSEPKEMRIYERWTVDVNEDDYCSYGERREG